MKLEFEWDNAKAQANLRRHGVSFELAKTVFKDPFAIERLDDREDYGEVRYIITGLAEGDILLYVAYTERENRIRLISARRVTQHEQEDYFRQNAWSHDSRGHRACRQGGPGRATADPR